AGARSCGPAAGAARASSWPSVSRPSRAYASWASRQTVSGSSRRSAARSRACSIGTGRSRSRRTSAAAPRPAARAGRHAGRGHPPPPPSPRRFAAPTAEDRERYQTVYARPPGSIAAPTAGLHFTPGVLEALWRRGVGVLELTLHVGPGTFQPVKTETFEDHVGPPERAVIPPSVADGVNRARAERRRVIAVGTTTTRALESAADADGTVRPLDGAASLTITPGYRMRVVDGTLTNFHLPRSSLLALVVALADRELVLKAYGHAVRAGYRFYSYGDATLILGSSSCSPPTGPRAPAGSRPPTA